MINDVYLLAIIYYNVISYNTVWTCVIIVIEQLI